MEKREQLGSRLGFIMISAGCAIGCGNVWKFPWMCGQNGGGGFMLIYLICLLILGLPVMTMEFSVGRAARTSPIYMYQKLEKPGHKWGIFGIVSLIGNITLMAFYTVVCGWLIYYFVKFITGQNQSFGFTQMIQNPSVNVSYLLITVIVAFLILSFDLQGGLERITKYMMTSLLVLMLVLAVHSLTLSGAANGLKFYLVPDFSKINGSVIVGAMNQAFFTLSVGMGGMAIFGSYIDKKRSLMGGIRHHYFTGHPRGSSCRDHHVPRLLYLRAGGQCRTQPVIRHHGGRLQPHGWRSYLGHAVFPVHGVRRPFNCPGCLRKYSRHDSRTHRLVTKKGLHCLRRRHLCPGSDDCSRLQRPAFSTLRSRHGMAGFLGFYRIQQCAAPRLPGAYSVLLQQLWLGLGEFRTGS